MRSRSEDEDASAVRRRERTRGARILVVGAALALAGYVALNVAFLAFAPMLHRLRCEVTVVDAGGASVSDVAVVLVGDDGAPLGTPAVTDARGIATLELVVQAQPAWAFPRIGTFDPRVSVAPVDAELARPLRVGAVSARDPHARIELVVRGR